MWYNLVLSKNFAEAWYGGVDVFIKFLKWWQLLAKSKLKLIYINGLFNYRKMHQMTLSMSTSF